MMKGVLRGVAAGLTMWLTLASDAGAQRQFKLITLERRPCYGTCPVYLVTVAGDGRVVFDGRQYVDSVGRYTSRMSARKVAALRRLFDEAAYFRMDGTYAPGQKHCSMYVSDAPRVITSIATATRKAKVEHDRGCADAPKNLDSLERKLDEMIGTARWIGHGGQR